MAVMGSMEVERGRAGAGALSSAGRVLRAVPLLHGWRRALLAAIAGASVSLAHAPFDFPLTLLIAFPVLVLLLDGIAAAERGVAGRVVAPLLLGWFFGFGMYWAELWWLGNALVTSQSGVEWAAPLAGMGLAALLALFPAVAVLAARQLWTAGSSRVLLLGAAWGLAELARSVVATGFPWGAIGYAAMPNALSMQVAALVGMDAVNVLVVWAAAAPALLLDARTRIWGAALPVAIVGAQLAFGTWRLAGAETEWTGTTVRIVQPAVPQDEKWDSAARLAIFQRLVDLSAAEGAAGRPDVVVWPETAVPFVLSETPEALEVIADALAPDQTLLAGGVRSEGLGDERIWFNSIFAIDGSGRIAATRDKVHLVPFGEYLPLPDLAKRLGLTRLVTSPADFTAASRRETLALAAGPVILPLICYEAIFWNGLGSVGREPTVMVNVTNDAWFGATPGPYQHMRQARMRAVETGLPLVRAANDGLSAVVDPYGRVVRGLGRGVRGAVDATLPAPVTPPLPALRALPLVWLLIGFAFAMLTVEVVTRRLGGG